MILRQVQQPLHPGASPDTRYYVAATPGGGFLYVVASTERGLVRGVTASVFHVSVSHSSRNGVVGQGRMPTDAEVHEVGKILFRDLPFKEDNGWRKIGDTIRHLWEVTEFDHLIAWEEKSRISDN